MNGALLVLKEWHETMAAKDVAFKTTTFHVQIHGLPPIYLHERTVEGIGNLIGELHPDSVRKCVVGNRYIRLRVDIELEAPLPAGFF